MGQLSSDNHNKYNNNHNHNRNHNKSSRIAYKTMIEPRAMSQLIDNSNLNDICCFNFSKKQKWLKETKMSTILSLIMRRKGCRDIQDIVGDSSMGYCARLTTTDIKLVNSSSPPPQMTATKETWTPMSKAMRIKNKKRHNNIIKSSSPITNKSSHRQMLLWLTLILGCGLMLATNTCLQTVQAAPEPSPISTTNSETGASAAATNQRAVTTTRTYRGPPMHGSIFGKRSLASNAGAPTNNQHLSSFTGKQAKVGRYEDIITEIIEKFLAKNAQGTSLL